MEPLDPKTIKLIDRLADLIVILAKAFLWCFILTWSCWSEWLGDQHDHAMWLLLFLVAGSSGWLYSIAKNMEKNRGTTNV